LPRKNDVVLSLYALANRTGFLKHTAIQSLFSKAYFLFKEHYEDSYTPLVRRHPDLFGGGHILDVGANIGYTAVLFAKALAPGFRLAAFEPEERNFAMLKRALKERHLEQRVVPLRVAVGEESGFAELWLNPAHHADHRLITPDFKGEPGRRFQSQRVVKISLDDYCRRELPGQPIGFIKIDVQGYEERVCQGMSETLVKNPQALIGLEYYPKGISGLGFDPSRVLRFFQERNYRVFELTRRGGIAPLKYGSIPGIVGKSGYTELLFSKSDKILSGNSH